MKVFNIIFRIVLGLLLITPILGAFGIFPAPTADMYSNPQAFAFIEVIMNAGYINGIMAAVFAFAIFLMATNRMAFAALLILPLTVNIVAFHAFLDGGIFTMGALMGNVLALLNIYFLWKNRAQYKSLWDKSAPVEGM